MFKGLKKYIAFILALVLCLTVNINVCAATIKELNSNDVFLKQQTSITCTLSSAAMMLRRTALCANYSDWEKITEKSIESEAWVESVGLRWKFTAFGMSVDHGYFSSLNKKQQIIDLLKTYPQGFVIYNSGSMGQKHAVFLCDYDEKNDIFYAADPANSVAEGRMPLDETSMAGATQSEIINNLNAYWFVTNPAVVNENGNFSAEQIIDSNEYNPAKDIERFTATEQQINEYYVVTSTVATNLRYYPSGNAQAVQNVKTGELLYIQSVGNNNFGAKWYKTDGGYYIFNTNLVPLSQYSSDIGKFNQTVTEVNATYSVSSVSSSSVPLRIDATEGNNVVAYVKNGTKLYITQSGFNSVGATWLRTEDGYYVKASETKFESSGKNNDSLADVEFIKINGSYSAEPIEDYSGESKLYKVTASSLNVRKTPVDGEIIGSLRNGECVEVIQTVDGWCNIIYNGNSAWVSLNYLVLVADGNSNSSATLSISSTTVKAGNKITCTVENDANNKYNYTVYSADGKVVYSPDKFTAEKSFTYTAFNAGKYYFGVEISDNNVVSNIYSANFNVYPELKVSSVKCNITDINYTNNMITWTVKTASDYDDVLYVYELYSNGKKINTAESYVASYSYTPKEKGDYYLSVYLKDAYSVSDTVKSDSIRIVDALTVKSFELGCSTASVGDNIVCTAKAAGGVGKVEYAFYAYLNGKVVANTDYSSENSAIVSLNASGKYDIYCFVRDEKGTVVKKSEKLTVTENLKGDVDFDGIVTSADARLVLRHSASLELLYGASLIAADVNKDGHVTSEDARLILRYAANLE